MELNKYSKFFSPYAWVVIIISVVIIVTSYLSSSSMNSEWYKSLEKPPGVIPDAWFSIIWGVLYIALVVGAVFALSKINGDKSIFTMVYIVVLTLTLAWIVSFSQHHMIGMGLAILLTIIIFAFVLVTMCFPMAKNGCYLPIVCFGAFFLWICVATYYNGGIYYLNPEKDSI